VERCFFIELTRLKRQHTAESNAKHGNDNNNDNDNSGSRGHISLPLSFEDTSV
jgi:hypothetical protein